MGPVPDAMSMLLKKCMSPTRDYTLGLSNAALRVEPSPDTISPCSGEPSPSVAWRAAWLSSRWPVAGARAGGEAAGAAPRHDAAHQCCGSTAASARPALASQRQLHHHRATRPGKPNAHRRSNSSPGGTPRPFRRRASASISTTTPGATRGRPGCARRRSWATPTPPIGPRPTGAGSTSPA